MYRDTHMHICIHICRIWATDICTYIYIYMYAAGIPTWMKHVHRHKRIYKWHVCLGSYILEQKQSSDIREKGSGRGQGGGHGTR